MAADPSDAANYADCGFDISHNNAGLNFNTLGAGGRRKYCILKVSEGTSFADPQFANFVAGLTEAGINRLGAYHFAHHDDPIGQMQYFIDTFSAVRGRLANPPPFLFMLVRPHSVRIPFVCENNEL